MTTPQTITIALCPVLEAYCRFVFETIQSEKQIKLNRKQDIGILINSHIQVVEFPPTPRILNTNQVTFILPINNKNSHIFNLHFVKLTSWFEQKIRDGIEYEYRKWITRMFDYGYSRGLKQRVIIEAILRGLNLRNNEENYEAIKKNDYRKSKMKEIILFKELLSADL